MSKARNEMLRGGAPWYRTELAPHLLAIVLGFQVRSIPVHSHSAFHQPYSFEVRQADLEAFDRACDDELRSIAFFFASSGSAASLWLALLLAPLQMAFSEVKWAILLALAVSLSGLALVFGLAWIVARWQKKRIFQTINGGVRSRAPQGRRRVRN